MKILFFDTETTGVHATARITQLAFQLYDNETLIREFSSLVKPNGWTVPVEKFFTDNNMSTERCELEGSPIEHVLDAFIQAYNECDIIVAHNIDFDRRVINYEFELASIHPEVSKHNICTMKSTIEFCKLPGRYDTYKWPRLDELHVKLFGETFTGAHDAMDDVKACAKCFHKLVELGVINC